MDFSRFNPEISMSELFKFNMISIFSSVDESIIFDDYYVPKHERIYIWQIMITPQGMSLPIRKFCEEKHARIRLSRMNVMYTYKTLTSTYKTTVYFYCVPAFVSYILNTHSV